MGVDDIVSDARMNRQRDMEPAGMACKREGFVRMDHLVISGFDVMPYQGLKQVCTGGHDFIVCRMIGPAGQSMLKCCPIRNRIAVITYETAYRLSISHAVERAGQHCQMGMSAGLVPGAELPLRHMRPHILLGLSLKGVFPIVNHARTVCRQMGDPSLFHHAYDHRSQAVLHHVGAIGKHDGGPLRSGSAYPAGDLRDVRFLAGCHRG